MSGAVGVHVGEEVQARAEPEAGPSTLAIVVFFHLKPPHYLVMLSVMGRASRLDLIVLVLVVRLGQFWVAVGWGLGVRCAGSLEVVGGGLGNW